MGLVLRLSNHSTKGSLATRPSEVLALFKRTQQWLLSAWPNTTIPSHKRLADLEKKSTAFGLSVIFSSSVSANLGLLWELLVREKSEPVYSSWVLDISLASSGSTLLNSKTRVQSVQSLSASSFLRQSNEITKSALKTDTQMESKTYLPSFK